MQKPDFRLLSHWWPRLPALALCLLGLAVAALGTTYRFGSLTSMGPGYFPVMLGSTLSLLALAVLRLPRRDETPEAAAIPWRPVISVSLGMLAWALLADNSGFIPATAIQIAISAFALHKPPLQSLVIMVLVLCGAGYFVFINQFGVPLPAFAF